MMNGSSNDFRNFNYAQKIRVQQLMLVFVNRLEMFYSHHGDQSNGHTINSKRVIARVLLAVAMTQ